MSTDNIIKEEDLKWKSGYPAATIPRKELFVLYLTVELNSEENLLTVNFYKALTSPVLC